MYNNAHYANQNLQLLLVSMAGFVTTTWISFAHKQSTSKDGGTAPRKDHAQDISLSFCFIR
jgi:hypothetical protein